MRALRNKASKTWTRALIHLSRFPSPRLLSFSFSRSSTPPPPMPEDNETIKKKSYQTKLEVPIILKCPSITMKLTVVSRRLTYNESIPKQQFNFIFIKEVMNTNGDSKETQLSCNQTFNPLTNLQEICHDVAISSIDVGVVSRTPDTGTCSPENGRPLLHCLGMIINSVVSLQAKQCILKANGTNCIYKQWRACLRHQETEAPSVPKSPASKRQVTQELAGIRFI